MPQLEITTFYTQFISILILIVIVYLTLSYVVLPQLLRVAIIRSKIVSFITTTTVLAPRALLTFARLLKNSVSVTALKIILSNNETITTPHASSLSINSLNLQETYTSYLSLLLIAQDEETN